MRVDIRDREALLAVSPAALAAYARTEGWRRDGPYRVHSDIYVGDDLPEIIVPRTERLGDYASVVADLIELFTQVKGQDELTVYRSLVTADRDVVRIRVEDGREGPASGMAIGDAVNLMAGAHAMLLAAACSLGEPRRVYSGGAGRRARDLLKGVRLGPMDQGGSVMTLLTPVMPSPMLGLSSDAADQEAPIERRLTRRLAEALGAARRAADLTAAGDDSAFKDAVPRGVSANLCDAVVRAIGPFSTLDVSVSWARTRPVTGPRRPVRFGCADAPLVREAARAFRERGSAARE